MATLGIAAAAAGAGTYAAFSDTESSNNTQVSAGTLNLDLNSNTSTSMNVGDLAPGDSGYLATELSNTGSINGNLETVNLEITAESDGTSSDFEENADDDGSELDDSLDVDILVESGTWDGSVGANPGSEYNANDGTTYASGTLMSVTGDNTPGTAPSLNPEETKYLVFNYTLPRDTTGNEVQGDSVTFDISITLEQA